MRVSRAFIERLSVSENFKGALIGMRRSMTFSYNPTIVQVLSNMNPSLPPDSILRANLQCTGIGCMSHQFKLP